MKTPTILWYFADPMCSWCWGFSPVLDQLKVAYDEQLKVALMMGGLRPGTIEPMTSELREEILHHWRAVEKMTGQKFNFDGAMLEGFVYDTEPPCRAVITVFEIDPESTLSYFKKIQEAFYIGQKNISDAAVLAKMAELFSIEHEEFIEKFNSDALKEKTRLHFQHTKQAEIRGFPSLVINTGSEYKKISTGYDSLDAISKRIDDWLQERNG